MSAPTVKPSRGFTEDELGVLTFLDFNKELSLWGAELFGYNIFGTRTRSSREIKRLLTAMVRRGLIRRVRKGVYAGNEGAK